MGFPCSSAGKESTYNAGDPGSIPGLGRANGEEIGYPLQYSWASLVAQLVKNPPAMQETWVRPLGWEDSLEKGMATNSSILAWRIPWIYSPWGLKESDTTEHLSFPTWCSGKESACQCKRCKFNPWVGKIPWRREWQPTPVFLPGESHGQRSLEA